MSHEEKKTTVHHILAHSYLTYFVALVLGLLIDYAYPFRIMSPAIVSLGPLLLILATAIIFWAQSTSNRTSHHRRNPETVQVEHFCKGPYCYTRSPTHIGLGLMVLGFGFLMNSTVIVVVALLVFLITRYSFVRREEALLARRYGSAYELYRKKVKF